MGLIEDLIVFIELSEQGKNAREVQSMSYNMKGGVIRPLLNTLARGKCAKQSTPT